MKEAWITEIRRMAELLENELSGRPVDPQEANELARLLARRFPDIRGSMAQISTRLASGAPLSS